MSRRHNQPKILLCLALSANACSAPPNMPETTTNVSGTDGVADAEGGQCFLSETPGNVGERYQCQGVLEVVGGATNHLGTGYDFSFGYPTSADSYERPFVNACCLLEVESPQCPEGPFNQHEWACSVDAIQQLCMGLGTKVEDVRSKLSGSQVFLNASLASLRDWLNEASSIDECASTFLQDTGADHYDCSQSAASLLQNVTWYPSRTDFGLIQDPYLRIGFLRIDDAILPLGGGDPCVDNHENDHNLPTEIGREGDLGLLLTAGSVTLNGPQVQADAVLASTTTGCTDHGCSFATINLSDNPGEWKLAGLQFQSVGTTSGGNASMSVDVDEYTISLFSPVDGTIEGNLYEIPSGGGLFAISGRTSFGDYAFSVSNITPILLHPSVSGWMMEPFEVGFVDENDDEWVLVIDAAVWVEATVEGKP